MLFIGVTRPMLDDSRAPNSLETPPIEYIPHMRINHNKNYKIMKPNVKLIRIIVSVLIAALTALGAAIGLNSCNVVRTITNKSEYYQRGDTSVMIQTKTTESYDATKK